MGFEKFVPVNKERFLAIIKSKNSSIRKLGTIPEIDRCEKAIRTYLNNGSIPYSVLDHIGQHLNVDPMFLAGKYDCDIEKLDNKELILHLKSNLSSDNYPYIKSLQSSIGFEQHFKNILTMNGINWKQYKSLSIDKRALLRQEMSVAIYSVIHKFFKKDAYENDTWEVLAYYEGMIGDLEPEFLEAEGEIVDWPFWLKKSK